MNWTSGNMYDRVYDAIRIFDKHIGYYRVDLRCRVGVPDDMWEILMKASYVSRNCKGGDSLVQSSIALNSRSFSMLESNARRAPFLFSLNP